MTEAPSLTAEPKAEGLLRRAWARIPTPVAVAVLGALLSAWFIPAITRQWQDQQKARELKATLVTRISRAATDALITSDFLVYGRLGGKPNEDNALPYSDRAFNDFDLDWRRESGQIDALLASYFPGLEHEWRDYASLVQNTYFLLRPRVYLRSETIADLRRLGLGTDEQLRLVSSPFMQRKDTDARNAYYFISTRLLHAKDEITREILHAHAAGYSQGPRDFAHDLLPFF